MINWRRVIEVSLQSATMKLSERFNRIFGAGGEGLYPLFYTEPQTYEVRYEAVIKNKAREINSLYVILPIPPDTPYQKILKEPQFFPKSAAKGEDPKFGNRYVYWQAELAPNESKILKEEFTVTVSPRKVSIPDSLTLDDYNPMRPGLIGFTSAYIDDGDERIKRIVQEVVGEERRVSEILRRLNKYVITHLVYGEPIKGLYSSRDALEREKVDCGGFDTLLVALCLAAGVPARIVSGFWAGYEKNEMHAWLEILLPNGEWITADPSVEHLRRNGRINKSGELGFVGSDRIALSTGCEIQLHIGDRGLTVDILQNPVVIADKPQSFFIETSFLTAQREIGR